MSHLNTYTQQLLSYKQISPNYSKTVCIRLSTHIDTISQVTISLLKYTKAVFPWHCRQEYGLNLVFVVIWHLTNKIDLSCWSCNLWYEWRSCITYQLHIHNSPVRKQLAVTQLLDSRNKPPKNVPLVITLIFPELSLVQWEHCQHWELELMMSFIMDLFFHYSFNLKKRKRGGGAYFFK